MTFPLCLRARLYIQALRYSYKKTKNLLVNFGTMPWLENRQNITVVLQLKLQCSRVPTTLTYIAMIYFSHEHARADILIFII